MCVSDGVLLTPCEDQCVFQMGCCQHCVKISVCVSDGGVVCVCSRPGCCRRRVKISVCVFQAGVLPTPCEDQQLLVELVAAIKVLPMDTLIQTVKAVLKQPPHTELSKSKVSPVHGPPPPTRSSARAR